MIYSGVDLIRRSDEAFQRGVQLSVVKPQASTQAGDRDPDQGGALLRFAKFVNKQNEENNERKEQRRKEKKSKNSPGGSGAKTVSLSGKHPYAASFEAVTNEDGRGQVLDIYV